VLTTDQKGAIAEAPIALAAIELGIGVSRPLGDERYDLIFDLRARFLRVQCKWASREARSFSFAATRVAEPETVSSDVRTR
jgi:hypothetical protein